MSRAKMPGPRGHWVRISTPIASSAGAAESTAQPGAAVPLNETMNRPPTEGATVSSVVFEKHGFGFVIVLHALSNGDPIVSHCCVATQNLPLLIFVMSFPNLLTASHLVPLFQLFPAETHANSGHFRRPFHRGHPFSQRGRIGSSGNSY